MSIPALPCDALSTSFPSCTSTTPDSRKLYAISMANNGLPWAFCRGLSSCGNQDDTSTPKVLHAIWRQSLSDSGISLSSSTPVSCSSCLYWWCCGGLRCDSTIKMPFVLADVSSATAASSSIELLSIHCRSSTISTTGFCCARA